MVWPFSSSFGGMVKRDTPVQRDPPTIRPGDGGYLPPEPRPLSDAEYEVHEHMRRTGRGMAPGVSAPDNSRGRMAGVAQAAIGAAAVIGAGPGGWGLMASGALSESAEKAFGSKAPFILNAGLVLVGGILVIGAIMIWGRSANPIAATIRKQIN